MFLRKVGEYRPRWSLGRFPAQSVSFRGYWIILSGAGFNPLSPNCMNDGYIIRESSQWFEKSIVRIADKRNCTKAWIGALATAM